LGRIGFQVLFATLIGAVVLAPQPAPAASRYVGTYYAVRAGADSLQDLTLKLDASGDARLTTRYPGYTKTAAGTPVYPFLETGTWTQGKDGTINLNLTIGGVFVQESRIKEAPENTKLRLRLTDSVLATVFDQNHTYGSAELLFRKADCK